MTIDDRDALLRLAIAPSPDAVAPSDLADAIYREVLATPQRRGGAAVRRLGWLASPSPLVLAIILLALLATALVVAGLLRPPESPILSMYHGGAARTGVMPGPGPAGVGTKSWDVARTGAIPFTSMPLPVADRVFVADTAGFLAALDVSTGETVWEKDLDSPISGAPALLGDLVVVATEAGDVVAVDRASGAPAWRAQLGAGAVTASLLVAEGVVYAGTEGGSLVALEPTNGVVVWSHGIGAPVTRSAAFADGVVYVGAANGDFAAVDVATGEERWRVHLAAGEVGTPGVDGGRIFVARGINGTERVHGILALDVRDGNELWSFSAPGGQQVHVGAIAHGRVYATAEDGNLTALDPASGTVSWVAQIGGRLTTLATVAGDVVYVGSDAGAVVAVDAPSGTELWRVAVVGDPTMAAVLGGRAFVGTSLGRVVAIGGSVAGS